MLFDKSLLQSSFSCAHPLLKSSPVTQKIIPLNMKPKFGCVKVNSSLFQWGRTGRLYCTHYITVCQSLHTHMRKWWWFHAPLDARWTTNLAAFTELEWSLTIITLCAVVILLLQDKMVIIALCIVTSQWARKMCHSCLRTTDMLC